jgi:hypothetical protein
MTTASRSRHDAASVDPAPARRLPAPQLQLRWWLARLLAPCLAVGALALSPPALAATIAPGETATPASGEPSSQAAAQPTTQAAEPSTSTGASGQAPSGGGSEGPGAPLVSTQPATATPPQVGSKTTATPQVQAQSPQTQSAAGTTPAAGGRHRSRSHPRVAGTGGALAKAKAKGAISTQTAPLPSALTPPFPSSLGSAIGGIPDFFIESFGVPPFLLPIYQAAGTAYGIPWQVLAAINEVETDYGRDLSVSSAGAEGWMQFLPSSWARYGVDANGDGYEDPYTPADAVFAAARYLAAAGGAANIRAAIYSYNHSQAYVDSVMLRAQLLGGTPPELLDAITGLTESRFPVHAQAHFADGFPVVPGTGPGSGAPRTLPGTTIYAPAGAPVIAVQDGQIVAVGDSPTLGRYISLRDAYGNTYTYAQLGSVAELYPVLEPRERSTVSARILNPDSAGAPRPSAPASAGVQPHSPLSQAAVSSGLAMGAAAALEAAPASAPAAPPALAPPRAAATPRVFRAGSDEVYLHALRPGVEVLAGTVLGHLGSAGEPTPVAGEPTSVAGAASPATPPAAGIDPSLAADQPEAHMLFQIRPAGAGAPLIDPKPILDGWVELENTSIFRAKGENPFLATSPTVGQVLLESKRQLEQQVLRDPGVRFTTSCGRGEVQAGQVDRRVLAALEFLSVSGLKPTVSSRGCASLARGAGAGNAAGGARGDEFDITAIDGVPIAGHEEPGSLADIAVHRLLRLQGTMRPRQIATGSLSYTGTADTLTLPSDRGLIHVAFAAPGGARAASVQSSPLTPGQWLALVARLGEIPEPTVAGKPSSAAIPDNAAVAGAGTAGGG